MLLAALAKCQVIFQVSWFLIVVLLLKSSKHIMAQQTYYTLITVLLRWP